MLLTYRTATGEVVDNTGTNSLHPWGPSDEDGYVNTDAAGIPRSDLEQLRLNDDDDAELVAQVLRRGCTVLNGRIVLNPVVEAPEQVQMPDPDEVPVTRAEYEELRRQLEQLLEQRQR